MKLFMHVGCSKTGTTSIQHTMHRNADFLRREYAINYPQPRRNHWRFALPFLKQDAYSLRDVAVMSGQATLAELEAEGRAFLAEFSAECGRYETNVLSSEAFLGLSSETLDGIASFCADRGFATKIIVYVRHPAERISSQINQKVRVGAGALAAPEPAEDIIKPGIERYVAAFGRENVIVRRFGRQYFHNGSLLDDFATVIHGGLIPFPEVESQNPSLSTPAILIANELNALGPWFSKERASSLFLSDIAGPKFKAPRAIVETAVKVHEPSLRYLAEEFDIHFDEVDLSQFPEEISHEFPPETIASLARILNAQALSIRRLNAEVDRLRKRNARTPIEKLLPRWARSRR